ncbi:MAG TPA: energy-coupling factor transporter ATPase [Syntrophorhabdaceae bacterium]|jgi:energy-coupling factor transport system ATP-binding protein
MAASVTIDSLSFTYRGSLEKALKDISAVVEEGAFVAIMGHSGAGKSTLLNTMNGLIPRFFKGEFKGGVKIKGKDVGSRGIVELSAMAGLVLQDFEAQLFSSNVELEVAFGPENQRLSRDVIRGRVERYLAFVGLNGLGSRDSATLSGGQKQRLAIASVLAIEPDVLLLDEPVTDLDPRGRRDVLSLAGRLRERKRTLIMVDTEPENVAGADVLWLMKEGELVAVDSTARIFSSPGLLESCGVMTPPTISLFQSMGWPGSPLTFEEAKGLMTAQNLAGPETRPALDPIESPWTGNPVLETRDLCFRYPGNHGDSLKSVNISIGRGEFVALLGQNGSGKTTLAKHFNGLLMPASGCMNVMGRTTGELRKRDLARLVGYVFQNPDHQIFASTVREEVGFGPRTLGESTNTVEENVMRALEATGLMGYEERSPFLLTRGERQRVAVASVLAVKPEIIVLDEPTTGLDYTYQVETMKMLRDLNERGHTIVIITHAMWIAESFASRVVVMREGEIISDGPTRRVFRDEERLARASLAPSGLVRLSNWLGAGALTVEGLVKELGG